MSISTRYLAVGAVLIAFTSGCGWFAEETASADGKDVDVEIDPDSGNVTVKSDEGDLSISVENDSGEFELTNKEGTVKIATGKEAKIPDDFPDDVPLFPGFKPDMVQSLPNGTIALAGSVQVSIPAVKMHYDRAARAQGWTETGSIAEQHVASLSYTKDDRMLQVTATPDVAGTMISLTTGRNASSAD